MKNVPIGIDDYLLALNSYYVDKTLFIKELLDYFVGKSLLITRPRRFGKSLMLSMVDYYFTNKSDYSFSFKDKKIFKESEKYLKEMNSFPVIRLNMKNISATSASSLIQQTISLISELYRSFIELSDSSYLFEIEKKEYDSVANQKYDDIFSYSNAIKNLSLYLSKHYKKKVIILIDEYDTPIQVAYENGFYDEVISFFKGLYSSALKSNDYLYFSVITGVLEVSKESLFSGLNNLVTSTVIDNPLNDYFGFNEEDVNSILKHYEMTSDTDLLKKWYGGYGVNKSIYNPWSILNYIYYDEYDKYWANTGTNSLINDLIEKESISKETLFSYINNNEKYILFDKAISYRDLNNNINALFSFLVQSGYLVLEKVEEQKYSVHIPNYEIENVFEKEIILRNNNEINSVVAQTLKDAILNKDVNLISSIISDYILKSFSYFEMKNEKDYQIMMTGILATLFDEYVVKSEVNSTRGRCDILVSPKYPYLKNGLVIELKKYVGALSNKTMNEYALTAIRQIKRKEYYQELITRGCKSILLYGFAFDNNKVAVKFEEITTK